MEHLHQLLPYDREDEPHQARNIVPSILHRSPSLKSKGYGERLIKRVENSCMEKARQRREVLTIISSYSRVIFMHCGDQIANYFQKNEE